MPLIKKDKATQYREAIVEKRAKSRRFGTDQEEKPKKKRTQAPVADESEEPQSLKVNKAILLLGLIPIAIAIMFAVKAWPKNAGEEQRHRSVCSHNLRAIHRIKDRVADELRLGGGDEIPESVAEGMILSKMNLCPAGGRITMGVVGDDPQCSVHGDSSDHELSIESGGMPSP